MIDATSAELLRGEPLEQASPPQYVYILSLYEEYGAYQVTATLDRSKVVDMLLRREDFTPESLQDEEKCLRDLLQRSDEELLSSYGHNLSKGWGGFQFDVVRLDAQLFEKRNLGVEA